MKTIHPSEQYEKLKSHTAFFEYKKKKKYCSVTSAKECSSHREDEANKNVRVA